MISTSVKYIKYLVIPNSSFLRFSLSASNLHYIIAMVISKRFTTNKYIRLVHEFECIVFNTLYTRIEVLVLVLEIYGNISIYSKKLPF